MVLMFVHAYSAEENVWKAFSLTQWNKRGREVTVNFWEGEVVREAEIFSNLYLQPSSSFDVHPPPLTMTLIF